MARSEQKLPDVLTQCGRSLVHDGASSVRLRSSALLFCTALSFVVGCGKPNLTTNCQMNGFGSGSCQFTNTGTAGGAVCGAVVVSVNPAILASTALRSSAQNSGVGASPVFCSGDVASQETEDIQFSVPAVRELCGAIPDMSWSQVCGLEFVPQEEVAKRIGEIETRNRTASVPQKSDQEKRLAAESPGKVASRIHIKAGLEAYQNGDYSLAVSNFKKAQELDEENELVASYLKMARQRLKE